MKLNLLTYFFEGYNFPMVRHLYPTNKDLWDWFNRQETEETRRSMIDEIDWILHQPHDEKEEIMRYLNQVGIMGPIRFKKVQDMISFLTDMKLHIICIK